MRTSVKGLLLGLLLALGACSSDPGIPVVTVTGEPVALLGVPTYYRATTTNGNDDLYAWETDNPVVATISTPLWLAIIASFSDVLWRK